VGHSLSNSTNLPSDKDRLQLAEAINYALGQWNELNVFCSDGAVRPGESGKTGVQTIQRLNGCLFINAEHRSMLGGRR
jgi:hypothetical protein